MDRVDIGDLGGADDRWNVQITQRQLWRTDADGFIGKAHVQGVAVGFAVNRDSFDSEFFAGADHPKGDFTAIGDKDLIEHELVNS